MKDLAQEQKEELTEKLEEALPCGWRRSPSTVPPCRPLAYVHPRPDLARSASCCPCLHLST
jgi:hypothetical protein